MTREALWGSAASILPTVNVDKLEEDFYLLKDTVGGDYFFDAANGISDFLKIFDEHLQFVIVYHKMNNKHLCI